MGLIIGGVITPLTPLGIAALLGTLPFSINEILWNNSRLPESVTHTLSGQSDAEL